MVPALANLGDPHPLPFFHPLTVLKHAGYLIVDSVGSSLIAVQLFPGKYFQSHFFDLSFAVQPGLTTQSSVDHHQHLIGLPL